jgi:hypothetical protein
VPVLGYLPSMKGKRPESAGCLWEWLRLKGVAALGNNRCGSKALQTQTIRSESVGSGFEPARPTSEAIAAPTMRIMRAGHSASGDLVTLSRVFQRVSGSRR